MSYIQFEMFATHAIPSVPACGESGCGSQAPLEGGL
jgi:hypothetical protein